MNNFQQHGLPLQARVAARALRNESAGFFYLLAATLASLGLVLGGALS